MGFQYQNIIETNRRCFFSLSLSFWLFFFLCFRYFFIHWFEVNWALKSVCDLNDDERCDKWKIMPARSWAYAWTWKLNPTVICHCHSNDTHSNAAIALRNKKSHLKYTHTHTQHLNANRLFVSNSIFGSLTWF